MDSVAWWDRGRILTSMSSRFYIKSPLAVGPLTITGAEAHHLAVVCRIRPGDAVCLFNGDGHQYPATVHAVSRRTVTVDVAAVESTEGELRFHLTVAAPLPKGDRAQFLLEKLTELGVSAFVPLRTERSVIDPGGARIEKLERYVIEASKQCGRNKLLEVRTPEDWSAFCRRGDLPSTRWLADPGGTTFARSGTTDTVVAVGPEGGFTSEEVELACQSGWRLVNLGPRILRIETAALAMAMLASLPHSG